MAEPTVTDPTAVRLNDGSVLPAGHEWVRHTYEERPGLSNAYWSYSSVWSCTRCGQAASRKRKFFGMFETREWLPLAPCSTGAVPS